MQVRPHAGLEHQFIQSQLQFAWTELETLARVVADYGDPAPLLQAFGNLLGQPGDDLPVVPGVAQAVPGTDDRRHAAEMALLFDQDDPRSESGSPDRREDSRRTPAQDADIGLIDNRHVFDDTH